MPATGPTSRLISTYTESAPWKEDHDQAMHCSDVEVAMTWGVALFRGLCRLEANLQARVLEGREAADQIDWDEFDQAYRAWVVKSEALLQLAGGLADNGFQVNGLDEFRAAVEEGRCQIELRELEPTIRPIEEALSLVKPDNPRPARYGT
jgi:hypothetical protein